MKKKLNIIYQMFACTLIFSVSTLAAQTGVLTQNPSAPLHIDAADDNAGTISAAQAANDVVVTTAGSIGVGVLAPVTKVDLRSSDQKGIIGLGSNSQTAGSAGAGAIRYNAATLKLEYSDGNNWIPLAQTAPTKVSISGTTASGQNVNNNTSTRIGSWTLSGDTESTFNSVNNDFTAPRPGFYLVSFSITLGPNTGAGGVINNSSFIETAIETSGVTTTTIPKFITVNSYPAFQASTIRNYISGNCNGIFYLNQGAKVFFTVKHTTGGTRTVLSDATLNNFSIQEL